MITNSNDFLTRLQEIENGIVSNKMINSTTESMVFIDSNTLRGCLIASLTVIY